MSLLIKLEIFEEPLARFYIAEVTCAVDSVHKMGFIHRCASSTGILLIDHIILLSIRIAETSSLTIYSSIEMGI